MVGLPYFVTVVPPASVVGKVEVFKSNEIVQPVTSALALVTAVERALVNVEAPAVAVTVKVYELTVLSVKVKVTEVLVAADVL